MTCDDLFFINTTQKTFKTFQKNVSISSMDDKKLHTREYQLKGIDRNMRCQAKIQKRFPAKIAKCSKHVQHITIEKDIFSELNRSIFQIFLS